MRKFKFMAIKRAEKNDNSSLSARDKWNWKKNDKWN